MSKIASACLMAGLITAGAAGTAMAAENPADPYAWLEDVSGDKSLDWVKQQNAASEGRLAQTLHAVKAVANMQGWDWQSPNRSFAPMAGRSGVSRRRG